MICPAKITQLVREKGELLSRPPNPAEMISPYAYEWMRRQMHKRIPGYRGSSIWWSWYRIDGITAKKPDLRNRALWHWGTQGEEWTRLELDVPSYEVLLSDVDLWPFVLNNWYLAYNEEESERWYKAYPDPKPCSQYASSTQSLLEKSWDRIFKFETASFDPDWLRVGDTIQGCFEVLRWRDVQAVTKFVNRPIRIT